LNFRTAFLAVVDALNGLGDLPAPSLELKNPEAHRDARALFVYWSPSYAGGQSDQTMEFIPADHWATHDDLSRAQITARVDLRRKPGDDPLPLLLIDKFQLIKDAIRTLAAQGADLDFTVWVSGVAPFYSADFEYAYLRVEITIGAFQD
jgi:hypothetical protein